MLGRSSDLRRGPGPGPALPSLVQALKVGLLDAVHEGQQVGVGLDLVTELIAGQLGGKDSEKVSEDQGIQLRGPAGVEGVAHHMKLKLPL